MELEEFVGLKVLHKEYGEGVIVGVSEYSLLIDYCDKKAVPANGYSFSSSTVSFVEEKYKDLFLEANKNYFTKKGNKKPSYKRDRVKNKTNKSSFSVESKEVTELIEGKAYGTTARNVYDLCCRCFEFDKRKAGLFSSQKKLYASDATKEGYAVWMIANSNWTMTKGGKWRNVISGDLETINEFWDKNTVNEFELDEMDRVIFAKSKDNVYVFLGVYKCAEIKHQDNVKIYKRISKTYK